MHTQGLGRKKQTLLHLHTVRSTISLSTHTHPHTHTRTQGSGGGGGRIFQSYDVAEEERGDAATRSGKTGKLF